MEHFFVAPPLESSPPTPPTRLGRIFWRPRQASLASLTPSTRHPPQGSRDPEKMRMPKQFRWIHGIFNMVFQLHEQRRVIRWPLPRGCLCRRTAGGTRRVNATACARLATKSFY